MLASMCALSFLVFLLRLIDALQAHRAAPPASLVTAFPVAATETTFSPFSKTLWSKNLGRLTLTRMEAEVNEIDAQTSASGAPIIDQEGRQWRSSAQLASLNLVRDGLADLESKSNNVTSHSFPTPFVATLRQHSLLLRGTVQGESESDKKGRFVNDDERWMHRYDALCKFHERYGHTCVPFRWGILAGKREDSEEVESTIRGGSHALIEDYVAEEDDLSFYDNYHEEDGLSCGNYDEDFKQECTRNSNNIQLSSEFTEPYLRLELGYWVAQQRHYYKQRLIHGDDGIGRRLTPDRIKYLNELDFIWDVKEALWETQFENLRDYVRHHGHACVTQDSTLGHWCYKQRYHKRNIENGVTFDLADIPKEAYIPLSSKEMQNLSISTEERVTETAAGGKEYKGRPVSPLTPERRVKLELLRFIWDVREQGEILQLINTISKGMDELDLLDLHPISSLGRQIPLAL
mmetsp:Transcript_8395/g.18139  ORF Transcript_8395/g.18139 Transcript_8395/m.18139 type:complete len:462 (-) Transcript_8395:2139-3524(-)